MKIDSEITFIVRGCTVEVPATVVVALGGIDATLDALHRGPDGDIQSSDAHIEVERGWKPQISCRARGELEVLASEIIAACRNASGSRDMKQRNNP